MTAYDNGLRLEVEADDEFDNDHDDVEHHKLITSGPPKRRRSSSSPAFVCKVNASCFRSIVGALLLVIVVWVFQDKRHTGTATTAKTPSRSQPKAPAPAPAPAPAASKNKPSNSRPTPSVVSPPAPAENEQEMPSPIPKEDEMPSPIPKEEEMPSPIPANQMPTEPPAPLDLFAPNPYVAQFNTTQWITLLQSHWKASADNAIDIRAKYGSYCPPEPSVPMCPVQDVADDTKSVLRRDNLAAGPSVPCAQTGGKERCGDGMQWLNKTIWPLVRGPFCAPLAQQRPALPVELQPYFELGYNRADPTLSVDAAPFDGGTPPNGGLLSFDPQTVTTHFLKFEAMLEHYYQGLGRVVLERHLQPASDSPLYLPMVQAYADQIKRVLLRAPNANNKKRLFVGVLGDSVTSGTDNCYYDAWPESFRRQMAPLFGAMGLELDVRNAAKNGGYHLDPQMLCAHDLLGAADGPMDFLFQCNPFVNAQPIDAEHLIRRTLLSGQHYTVISMTYQGGKYMEAFPFLETYAAAGLTFGTPYQMAPPELGLPTVGHKYWFPDLSRSFWGMSGDGFCHLTTRAGSAPVVNRNWHWGPKLHETYADAHALLFSRAARLAISQLAAGQKPPAPPAWLDPVLNISDIGYTEGEPPSWKQLLHTDMTSQAAVQEGLSGVRCAVGLTNQPAGTGLKDWLRPADGSPFEATMKARNGVTFVPLDHLESTTFYQVRQPISPPNKAVPVGDWVANPQEFGAEAPHTLEQCNHVDGSTLVNYNVIPEGLSWFVWEVPKGVVKVGRIMACILMTRHVKMPADWLSSGGARFHVAFPSGNGWKVMEDVHKITPTNIENQDCAPILVEMIEADLKAAREGGMWVAIEWKKEAILPIDTLVAI